MKYKKKKLRLNEITSAIQCFYFLVKFGLVLIYILNVYRKGPLQFYWEKTCSIHYFHFSFEKHVPSQVFKDFPVENLETTPINFHVKLFSEIYLGLVKNLTFSYRSWFFCNSKHFRQNIIAIFALVYRTRWK